MTNSSGTGHKLTMWTVDSETIQQLTGTVDSKKYLVAKILLDLVLLSNMIQY